MKPIKLFALSLAFTAVAAVAISPLPALADDEPALADGGALVSSTDGGAYAVGDLGLHGCQSLAVRPEGAQSTRYKLCVSSVCVPTTDNEMLDYDTTVDIPVNCRPGLTPKQYIGLRTDDGGVPFVKVQRAP